MKQRRVRGSTRRRSGRVFLAATTGALLTLSKVLPRTEAQNATEDIGMDHESIPTSGWESDLGNSTTTTTSATPLDTSTSTVTTSAPTTTIQNDSQIPATTSATAANPTSSSSTVSSPASDPTSPPGLEEVCGGLNCLHDSTCEAGNATYNLLSEVGFHTITNQNGFHCKCPKGYAGLDCSRPYQECRLSAFTTECYHGGVCLPESDVEDAQYASFCECSQAFFNGQRYAGKYCEVAVEDGDYCPDQPGLFCLNGGTCPIGGARAPRICTCREGYFGEHCEFKTPEGPDCTLKCFNEGVCKVGRVNAPWGNRDDFYCDCPKGYGGVQCEHFSVHCGDGETICLHGATCESTIAANGKTEFSCKCPETYLGGSSCQEKRGMEFCNPTLGPEYSLSMAVPAFCLNGGTCRDVVNGGSVDFACDCPPLFEGPHCEFLKTAEAIGDINDFLNPPGSEKSAGMVAGTVLLTTLVVVAGFFVVRQARRIRQSRKREQDVILNLQDFREENFGARSANGSMLFPGVSPPPTTIPESNSSSFTTGELMHDIDIT